MTQAVSSSAALYRTVWRWHFYAGLVVAPFMLILAVTGAIYLFNDEINDIVYRQQRLVPPSTQSVPLSQMITAALADDPEARATRIDTPREAGRSAEVFVTPATGAPRRVFVDPGTGQVLGSYVYARTLVGFADLAHGSLLLGDFGDGIVELAACWGFILMVTGLYLWWPRGQRRLGGVVFPRWRLGGRRFWKDWHAVIGMWTALLVMFLILTGLPWATVWGDLLRRGTDLAGIGYPVSHRLHGALPGSAATVKQASTGAAPWTIAHAPMPQSDPHAHHGGHGAPAEAATTAAIGIDAAVAILAREGMMSPYRLSLPRDARGAFVAFTYPDQPETQRTISIDQYSGRILGDVGFADYGWAAKAVELGVQIHMGNYFGRLNQIVMLIPCLGIIVLSVTGPIMWWRRRPKGKLGAPRALAPAGMRSVALIILALGLVFPLAGASLIVVLTGERLVGWIAARPRWSGAA
ncbi:PepSY-associated TM helix domain-containing protein [Phreatobacter stygius]|nr:PepSY domain-containing protein [Phreatobacter stygius]